MRGLRLDLILALVTGGPTAVSGQNPQDIQLVGRVRDQLRRPIAGVEVVVNRRELRATTNGSGVFTISVSARDSTVAFRRIGYRPMLVVLHPLPPTNDTILVELVESPVQLPEVITSAPPIKPLRYAGTTKYDDVFLRQRVGFGTLITRDMVDNRLGGSTADLLQGIPGVRVSNGLPKRIQFARCQDPGGIAVFIDGSRQIPGSQGPGKTQMFGAVARPSTEESPEVEMLSRVHPRDVEMIEVYRGVSQIPGAYHWNGCAVVAVWTRWNK